MPTIIVITTLSARTTSTQGETLCVKREAGQTELSYSGSSEQRSEQARGRIMSDFLLDESVRARSLARSFPSRFRRANLAQKDGKRRNFIAYNVVVKERE